MEMGPCTAATLATRATARLRPATSHGLDLPAGTCWQGWCRCRSKTGSSSSRQRTTLRGVLLRGQQ